jgi:hypothetical protein
MGFGRKLLARGAAALAHSALERALAHSFQRGKQRYFKDANTLLKL